MRKHRNRKVKLVENYLTIIVVVELNRQTSIEITNKALKITTNVDEIVVSLDDISRKIKRLIY